MGPFKKLVSIALPMPEADIDTDRILPSRFMQKSRAEGLGRYFFHDQRFLPDGRQRLDFVTDDSAYRDARILVAGENFGCGSSREQAVYAVCDFGFRAVIAPSFGEIFYVNALKNGLLPVILDTADVQQLLRQCEERPETLITIDLETQSVAPFSNGERVFPIDAFNKTLLSSGQDEIAFTLTHQREIADFEQCRTAAGSWL